MKGLIVGLCLLVIVIEGLLFLATRQNVLEKDSLKQQIETLQGEASEVLLLSQLMESGKTTPEYIHAESEDLASHVQSLTQSLQRQTPSRAIRHEYEDTLSIAHEMRNDLDTLASYSGNKNTAAEIHHSVLFLFYGLGVLDKRL